MEEAFRILCVPIPFYDVKPILITSFQEFLPSSPSAVSIPAIPSVVMSTTAFPLPQMSTSTSPSKQTGSSIIKKLHKKMRLSKVFSVRKFGKKNGGNGENVGNVEASVS
jgi:hypothetical protein